MAVEPTRIGIIGCGNICGEYVRHAQNSPALEVVACADIVPERAEKAVSEHGVPRACSVDELLADPAIELVVNLTNPVAHVEVSLKVIAAGKHLYTEKPIALTRDDAGRMLAAARERGVRIGCAPDTFLTPTMQTCRTLLDDGTIGEPVCVTAFWMDHGPECWHPAPDFLFKPGAGPMFDIGPYYISVLVALVGPIRRVAAMTRTAHPTRTVGSGPLQGSRIDVEVPTFVAGTLELGTPGSSGGPIANIITTWDIAIWTVPFMEIHGTRGSLWAPNPTGFGGTPRLRLAGEREWHDVAPPREPRENPRGFGVTEMAAALRSDRPHRASAELAAHVLDVMHAFIEAADAGRTVELTSTCERPAPLPGGSLGGELDE